MTPNTVYKESEEFYSEGEDAMKRLLEEKSRVSSGYVEVYDKREGFWRRYDRENVEYWYGFYVKDATTWRSVPICVAPINCRFKEKFAFAHSRIIFAPGNSIKNTSMTCTNRAKRH